MHPVCLLSARLHEAQLDMQGLYTLNFPCGRQYVGSTCNLLTRLRQHRLELRCNRHSNTYMQRVYNKKRGDILVNVEEFVGDTEALRLAESQLIATLKPELNLTTTTTSPMDDPETVKRIRAGASRYQSRAVYRVDTGEVFSSGRRAAASVGVNESTLYEAIKLGTRAGGTQWARVGSAPLPYKSERTNKRAVMCVNTGQVFESCSAAARALDIHPTQRVYKSANEKLTCKGYTFVFMEPRQ